MRKIIKIIIEILPTLVAVMGIACILSAIFQLYERRLDLAIFFAVLADLCYTGLIYFKDDLK